MQEFVEDYKEVQVLFDDCEGLVALINARNFSVHRGAKFPRFVFRCHDIDRGYIFEGDGYSPEMFKNINEMEGQLYHHFSADLGPDGLIVPDNWTELDKDQKVNYLMGAVLGAVLTIDRRKIEVTLALKLDENSEPIEFDELDRMVTGCLDHMLSVAKRLSVKKYI